MKTVNSREIVWGALFDALRAIPCINLCTRKLKAWQECPKEDQPAIYLTQTGEDRVQKPGIPAKYLLEGNIYIYVSVETGEAGYVLNPVLDAIDLALEPDETSGVQTLGGIVHHCWVEGQTQIFEGSLGDEAVAVVPIKILVT